MQYISKYSHIHIRVVTIKSHGDWTRIGAVPSPDFETTTTIRKGAFCRQDGIVLVEGKCPPVSITFKRNVLVTNLTEAPEGQRSESGSGNAINLDTSGDEGFFDTILYLHPLPSAKKDVSIRENSQYRREEAFVGRVIQVSLASCRPATFSQC